MPSARTLFCSSIVILLMVCTTHAFDKKQIVPPPPVESQGTIRGHVTDASGAVVANANVKAVNQDTGKELPTTKSAQDGSYSIPNAPFGRYVVTITANGFKSAKICTSLSAGNEIEISPTLQPGKGESGACVTSPETSSNAAEEYVRVSVNGVLGPMGYVSTPSLGTATQMTGIDPQTVLASTNFNFPSLILYISAVPVVQAPPDTKDRKQWDKIKSAQETDRNPKWLDATFTIEGAKDKDGNTLDIADVCKDKIQVLGLLPQQTITSLKNQVSADAASAVNDVGGALTSFYPGVKDQVTSATQALNVLFKDIFPPRPVAYQYSYMNGNCIFGWFFRQNLSASAGAAGPASLLGTQTGIVLLKTNKNIKQLTLSGVTLSFWENGRTTSESKNIYLSGPTPLPFELPNAENIDYDVVTDLKAFPALISKEQAKKILHITSDDDWNTLVTSAKLVTTPNNAFVTNASLNTFVTQTQATPPPKPVDSDPPAIAVKASNPADKSTGNKPTGNGQQKPPAKNVSKKSLAGE